MTEDNTIPKGIKIIAIGLVITIAGGVVWMIAGAPQWNVWQRELQGKAELAQATYNRQIAVQEAEAKKEASKSLAEAEVIRAEGVAKANEIIGQSLENNEAYLRYLWIDSVANKDHQIIYVPTETNMPILEAGRTPIQDNITK